MKYFLIESKFITRKLLKVKGIVLYPFVFVDDKTDIYLVNHELIHIEQIKDCGVFKFYFKYLYWWRKLGYWNIPFEIEAFFNDHNLNYIKTRGRKKWIL
jgi:hypothetical protein